MGEFINPNWHVIAIHFPLGLLVLGIILEWLSFAWPKGEIRTGARWMILMGALLAIPTTTLGIYAYRDVVTPDNTVAANWQEVVQTSQWSADQWRFMRNHIWLEAIGTVVAVLAVVLWLAMSDEGRSRLYWPGLIVLTAALGCMVAGSWYSGESVYRYGTAVMAVSPPPMTGEPREVKPVAPPDPGTASAQSTKADHGHDSATHDEHEEHEHEHEHAAWVQRYLPPIQMHLLSAGGVLAFAAAAIGLSIRRWSQPLPEGPAVRVTEPKPATVPVGQPVAPAPALLTPGIVLKPVYAARFWVVAFLLGAGTALGGLWMTDDWRLKSLIGPLKSEYIEVGDDRVFWHVIFGVTIVISTLLLAFSTRVFRRARLLTGLLIVVLLIAAGLQVWMGILLLYDSPQGSLTRFGR